MIAMGCMMIGRRGFVLAGVLASVLAGAATGLLPRSIARAQDAWPQRTLTIVVPFLAGGSADLVARIFGQHFQAKYGVSVVIENKGGAGGSIGTGMVAKAPADGYTLVLHQSRPLQQAPVRQRAGFRADLAVRALSQSSGGAKSAAGEKRG
jgi:tripartite-type tricarboxylate transporter receptor subunit TctC